MHISVQCPHCSARLKAKLKHVGRELSCPKCGQMFLVSAPKEEDGAQTDRGSSGSSFNAFGLENESLDPLGPYIAELGGASESKDPFASHIPEPSFVQPSPRGDKDFINKSKSVLTMPPLVIRIVASVGALVVLLCGLLGLGIWSFSIGDTESPNSVPVNVSNNDSNRARNTVPASGVPVTLTTARQTNSLEELKDATVFIQVQSPEGFPADVFKSAIATIRRDEHNNILTFEADHEIGPGYSGGPVVTEDGQLVGIAVAKNADADSEFVIGKWQISQALAGRSTGLTLGTIEKSEERHRYRVIVHLLDPFESVASVDVLTCPAEHLKESEPSSDGSWPRVRDEMTSEHCQIYWRPANVTASVDFSTPPSKTLIQIMLVRKDGTKWYDQPKTLQPVAPNP